MSKETQSKSSEKTESALNSYIWLVVFIAILVVGVMAYNRFSCDDSCRQENYADEHYADPAPVRTVIDLVPGKGAYFKPTYLNDQKSREKGLSGRASLAKNEVMIFKFDTDDYHQIWMKDMKFAIDIVWTDAGKKVVYVEKAVAPETYPKTFAPDVPARYVLELSNGRADSLGIAVGTQLKF